MKIQRIRCINFLSHSDTTVDFRNVDSVVAVGANGAGKSSFLVDSILCCLFGRGRASDIDSFVRVGKDLMQLEVDFSINGACYRAVRKRSRKTARGTSMLELFEIDGEGNEIKNLTLGTVAETQALIEKVLGINYDVLVRSAIIEQGEADSFVEATPSERMELFSEIWDLKKYEDFAQIARDTVKELTERLRVIDERIDLSKKKIGELVDSVKDKEVIERQLNEMDMEILRLEKKKEDFQKKIGSFDALEKEIEMVKSLQEEAGKELEAIGSTHGELISKIDRFDKIIKNSKVVKEKVGEEKKKEQVIVESESVFRELSAEINRYKDEIETLRKDFQKKVDILKEQEKTIDSELSKLNNAKAELSREIGGLRAKEEKLRQMYNDAEKLKGLKCHPEADLFYVNENCRFIRDAVEAKKKIPFFEREIEKNREDLEGRISDIQSRISEFEKKKEDLEREVKGLRIELDNEICKLEGEVSSKKIELKRVEDEIEHAKLELLEIRGYTKLLPEINLAEQELPKLIEEEKRLSDRCKEIMYQVEERRKQIGQLEERLAGKANLEKEFKSTCLSIEKLQTEKQETVKRLGFIEAGIKQMGELRAQIEADEREQSEIISKKSIYQILEEAFKQIPYMLISRSIGAVERKANEILGFISSSGLRVEIKTEKMAKTTKKMKDEIHIIIHDNDGEKPYKFLSGGEKLRVALALRLAIGEVFASRRGANIETLIADEIFGPLDEEGVEDVKQVFRELRRRFKFIGVISHITESKDMFETQLFFEKGENGTVVRLIDNFS